MLKNDRKKCIAIQLFLYELLGLISLKLFAWIVWDIGVCCYVGRGAAPARGAAPMRGRLCFIMLRKLMTF